MAFVEQRGNRFPLPAPDLVTASAHTLQQPVLTQQPVAPPHAPLYHLRPPAFCPRCYSQFNGSFTLGGMCPNCSCVLPSPQLALRPPPLPQPMVRLPLPHTETRHDDHFLMTDMLHVIDDVLKEQEDADHMTSSSPGVIIPSLIHAESARQCQCGSKEAVVFCSVRQLFLCSVCLTDQEHSAPLLSPAPHLSTAYTTAEPAVMEDGLQTCSTHDDQKASLFCHSCLSTVCSSCAQSDHSGHAVMGLNEAYTRYHSSVEQLLSKSQVEIKLLELSRSGAEKMRESVGEKQVMAVERVKQIFKEHRALLDKREQEVRHTTVVAD